MYVWNEKSPHTHEFEPVTKNVMIAGYNMETNKLFLKELRDSGFFAERFITYMNKIVQDQNKLLSSGKMEWLAGDMSQFEGDMNICCDCQDQPADIDKITFHFKEQRNTNAKFYWNWEGFGEDSATLHYHMHTVKGNGIWKIAYMQGWDYNANLAIE